MMLKQLIISEGYEFVGFFDENRKKNKNKSILGRLEDLNLNKKKFDFLLLGMGDNYLRANLFKNLKKKNYSFLTFVHSSVKVCESVKIKEGSVVLMGAIVNSNSIIDEASINNSGSIIEHDCHIKFSSHICPGVYLAGNVSVGKYSMIGLGSRVIQNIKILDKVVVGAGSIILKDINKSLTVKGIYN